MKASMMNQTHRIHTFEKNFLGESSCRDAILIHTETLKESPPAYGECGRGASINRGERML